MLSWRLSNTMEAEFCVEALQEALARHGAPEIFNTDQGSQFTSPRFVEVVQARRPPRLHGRARPVVGQRVGFATLRNIERLWRSLKYECVYLHAFETDLELRTGLSRWIGYYNAERHHSAHGGKTPDEVYGRTQRDIRLAALYASLKV